MSQIPFDIERAMESHSTPTDTEAAMPNPEAIDSALEHLVQAENVLGIIKQTPGGIDGHVANMVGEANESGSPEDAQIADLVGELSILNGGNIDNTAQALGKAIKKPFRASLDDLFDADSSGVAVQAVMEAIKTYHIPEVLTHEAAQRMIERVDVFAAENELTGEAVEKITGTVDTVEILPEPKHSERIVELTQALLSAVEKAGQEKATNSPDVPYWDREKQQVVLNELYEDVCSSRREQVLRQDLASSSFSYEELSALLGTLRRVKEFLDNGWSHTKDRQVYGDPLSMLDTIPAETVSQMYHSNRDSESGNLKYMLRQTVLNGRKNEADTFIAAKLLAKIHGVNILQLRSSKAVSDPIVRAAVGRVEFGVSMVGGAEKPKDNSEYPVFTRDIRDNQLALLRQFGLSDRIAHLASRAMNEQTMKKDENGHTVQGKNRCVNASAVGRLLENARLSISDAGPEAAIRASERWGLVNFANYYPNQLQRMSDLAEEKPELIEHLQKGDVTVVFTDALGDHNGAFRDNGTTFEKYSGRTLFFEIHSPKNYYEHLVQLKRMGIRPSTIVVANHGSPGGMKLGEGEDRFVLSNEDPDHMRHRMREMNDDRRADNQPEMRPQIALLDAKGLEVLVERYMQPGKGVDDEAGAITFILQSCSQAKERPVVRRRADGIPQTIDESTAETFTKKLNQRKSNPQVRTYASSVPSNISRTAEGLQFTREAAHEFTTDEHGRVIRRTVETIPYDEVITKRMRRTA